MDKILELLGVNKLDEETGSKIKDRLTTFVESEVQKKLDEELKVAKETLFEEVKKEKESLVEKYEQKFEEYKESITNKFSDFLDEILEEELVIPDQVLEYAKKGELYSSLIEQFKIKLGIDEGLINDEVKSLLKEAKESMLELKNELNEKIGEVMELTEQNKKLEAKMYLIEKVEGLTDTQKSHVMNVLEGLDKEQIDKKFDIVLESISVVTDKNVDDDDDKGKGIKEVNDTDEINEDVSKLYNDPQSPFNSYLQSVKRDS